MNLNISNNEKIKIVFILCANRSGSTWLSYVLGSHTEASYLGEFYRPFVSSNINCSFCEANENHSCEYFNGIDKIDPAISYQFVANKFNKNILIDCSKKIEWIEKFISNSNYEIKVIHLIRDPRAWYASEKRRKVLFSGHNIIHRWKNSSNKFQKVLKFFFNPIKWFSVNKKIENDFTIESSLEAWLGTNHSIENFIESNSLDHIVATYDELCVDPDQYLQKVTDFIGASYENQAIEYWNYEHHGFGSNGASFNNLGKSHNITTSDDSFYKKMAKKHFYDVRWRNELKFEEIHKIENDLNLNEYLRIKGIEFNHLDRLIEEYLSDNT